MKTSVASKTSPSPVALPATAVSWRWYLSPSLWLRRIVHLQDSPHSIAMGAAIGTFVAFTPTVGIQMLLVLLIGWILNSLLTFNRISALIAVYISNPITTLPIYWFNYWVGSRLVGGELTRERLSQVLEYKGFAAWWQSLYALTIEIGWPLLLGSFLVGLVCAVGVYPLVKSLTSSIQRRQQSHT